MRRVRVAGGCVRETAQENFGGTGAPFYLRPLLIAEALPTLNPKKITRSTHDLPKKIERYSGAMTG